MTKKAIKTGLLIALISAGSLNAEKSKFKAIVLSALVPGAGQAYMGETSKAEVFIGLEIASWATYFGFRHHGYALENEAVSYAYTYGNLSVRNPNEDFWYAVEMNQSRSKYIEKLFREARQIYPDSPDSQVAYVNANAVAGSWSWPGETEWFHFQDLRRASRDAYQRALVVTGVMIANRIASVVELIVNKRASSDSEIGLNMGITPGGVAVVGLSKKF